MYTLSRLQAECDDKVIIRMSAQTKLLLFHDFLRKLVLTKLANKNNYLMQN